MTPRLPEPSEVQLARRVLEDFHGEKVRPVSQVCEGIFAWLEAVRTEHLEPIAEGDFGRDAGLHALAVAVDGLASGPSLHIMAAKSNLLYRLLYVGEQLRTEKCPEHKGHWAGCPWPGEECPHGCAAYGNTTGWLPTESPPSDDGRAGPIPVVIPAAPSAISDGPATEDVRDIVAAFCFLHGPAIPDALYEHAADLPAIELGLIRELVQVRRDHATTETAASARDGEPS